MDFIRFKPSERSEAAHLLREDKTAECLKNLKQAAQFLSEFNYD